MTPYVSRYITIEEVSLFEKIKKVVTELPDIDLGEDDEGKQVILSCHILGHALAKVFSLQYRYGYFYPNYCHNRATFIFQKKQALFRMDVLATLGFAELLEKQ